MELAQRKQIRLKEYDYSQPGAYFITVCSKDRQALFWNQAGSGIVGAAISRPQNGTDIPCRLSHFGQIVEQAIQNIDLCYEDVCIDKYVIMPDHIHVLLRIERRADNIRPYDVALSTVIGQMKRWASKEAGEALWQKSFYEHVIRGDEDYREVWSYIEGNPGRWLERQEAAFAGETR